MIQVNVLPDVLPEICRTKITIMPNENHNTEPIHQGILKSIQQITRYTFHIKIASPYFSEVDYVPGFTIELFVDDQHIEHRKYSIWNYEPVQNVIDIAICTFSNGKGAHWVHTLEAGDTVCFKTPRGKLLIDESADNYVMIGDITALSHLYEINRNLPVGKTIFSFIYTPHQRAIFPDIDGSFPFDYHVFSPFDPEAITTKMALLLPQFTGKRLAYITGAPEVCQHLKHYFRNEANWDPESLRVKAFWR